MLRRAAFLVAVLVVCEGCLASNRIQTGAALDTKGASQSGAVLGADVAFAMPSGSPARKPPRFLFRSSFDFIHGPERWSVVQGNGVTFLGAPGVFRPYVSLGLQYFLERTRGRTRGGFTSPFGEVGLRLLVAPHDGTFVSASLGGWLVVPRWAPEGEGTVDAFALLRLGVGWEHPGEWRFRPRPRP